MKKRISNPSQPSMTLIFLLAGLLFLLGNGKTAHAGQYLYWDYYGGSTFKAFGPNASITIADGAINYACDGFARESDVYVIESGGAADNADLNDISNGEGLPNTIVTTATGGIFISETIGFSNVLGSGLYAVVYDECQDGKYNQGEDFLIDPAFEVNVPAGVEPITPAMADLKNISNDMGVFYKDGANAFKGLVDGLDYADYILHCTTSISGCVMKILISKIKSKIKAMLQDTVSNLFFNRAVLDPQDAAYRHMFAMGSHYAGIAADPPDPDFRKLTLIEPIQVLNPPNDNLLAVRSADYSNTAATEAALAEALLKAIERYQGAQLISNGDGALLQARAAKTYAKLLAQQLQLSNGALSALSDVVATLPWDVDHAADLEAWSNRVETQGFIEEEISALRNLEIAEEFIEQARNDIAALNSAADTPALLQGILSDIILHNLQVIADLNAFVTEMEGIIDRLKTDPYVLQKHPVADAGGPYTATSGTPVILDGSASSDHNGTVDVYEWDLNRDGVFDDAVGENPSVIFQEAFDGLVALRVTNNEGWQAVDYARVSVTGINGAPAIVGFQTEDGYPDIEVGETLEFSVSVSDPDGDNIFVEWYLDGVMVGSGFSFTFNPVAPDSVGMHIIQAVVSDDSPYSGRVVQEWAVSVLTPDNDSDLWRSNIDCDDSDPEVNPGEVEIIANSKDDDCNPDTFDMPPIAAFSFAPDIWLKGDTIQFNDESTPRAGNIVMWEWDFGDGETSSLQHPTHVYSESGAYTITLTVTDSEGAWNTISRTEGVVDPPTAALYSGPTRNVALLEDGALITDFSSSYSTFVPESAIDGSETSAWYSNVGENSDQWITVALAGNQTHVVDRVVLKGNGGTAGIRHFDVLVSNSGVADDDFSTVVSAEVPMDVELHEFAFAPVAARYVKLFVYDNWGYINRIVVSAFQVWTRERQLGIVSMLEGPPATIADFSSYNTANVAPENLLDDSPSSRWSTAQNQITDQWVSVALPGETAYTIGRVALKGSLNGNCPQDFEIRVSTNGIEPGDFVTVLTGMLQQNDVLQEFSFGPTPARYVQLFIQNNYGGSYIDVYAFEILTPDGANLARASGVGAFVMDASSQGTGPENAIDYSTTTYWQTTGGDVADQWLKIRLIEGGPYPVDSFLLMGRNNDSSPQHFQVRVSADTLADTDFVTVFSGILPRDGLSHWFTFPAVEAKYIQLFIEDNYGGNNVTILDFKVFTSTRGDLTFSADDFSQDDDGSIVAWEWDFGDGTVSTDPYPSHTYAGPGIYTVTLTVTDNDGLTDTVSIQYTALQPLFVDFTWSPVPAVERDYTTLTGIFTDPNSQAVEWLWTFDHTSSFYRSQFINTNFPDNGVYEVTLTVTDSQLFTASVTKSIPVENLAPTVIFSDKVVLWGDPIIITPSIVEAAGDRDTLTYFWDLDNGDTLTERNVNYTYYEAGVYDVQLSVTDKDGAVGSNTAVFTVNKRPTTLEYVGNISGDPGTPVLLRVRLYDTENGNKLPDKEITLTLNGRTYTAVTNQIGIAQLQLTADLGAGDYQLTASFEEDDQYLGSTDESSFTVPDLLTTREPGYSSIVFTVADVVFFSYKDGTLLELFDSGGNRVWNNDGLPLDKGGHAHVVVDQGAYRATGSEKFSVLTGDPITRYVCGYYAMDQNGYGTSTEFYTWVPKTYSSPPDTQSKFIVFAYEDDTQVTVEHTDTGIEIAVLSLNKGEHWEITGLGEEWLHVTADKPVSALTSYDQGFFVPASTGRWSGTEFYTYVGYVGGWLQDLTVMSFGDDNQVTITNSETGERLWSGTLDSGDGRVERFRADNAAYNEPRQYITVTSSDAVTVAVQPWVSYTGTYGSTGYHQGAYVQNLAGSGIGTDFIGSTLGGAGYMYLLGYNEDTIIDVFDSQTGAWVDSHHVNRGEFVEINPGNGLWRIKSDKYVSAYSGWGTWNADFSPVEFGDVVNPLNLVKDDGIDASDCVAPGERITYDICFDNTTNAIDLHQVIVSDLLPAETNFISATNGGDHDSLDNAITWNIGTLTAGTQQQCVQVTVEVDSQTPLGIILTNKVNAASRETNLISRSVDTNVCATPNSIPVANDDSFTVDEGATLTVAAPGCLANDSDGDNDPLTAELVDAPTHGELTFEPDGGFVYRTAANFDGQIVFHYRVHDGKEFSDPANVTVTVKPTNDPPIADANGPYTENEGTAVTLDGTGSHDPNGDPISFAWDLDGDGDYDDASGPTPTYTWLDNGTYTVGLKVSDGAMEDTATAIVIVNDRGPTAAVSGDTPINEGQTGNFDANGSSSSPDYIVLYEWDLDGDGQYDDATGATAAYTWLDNGVYPVSVRITDEDGSTDAATIQVTVNDLGPTAVVTGDIVLDEGQTGTCGASGSSSSPDYIVLYEWDLDGDGQFDDATGATASYSWLDNGVYSVAVRITDEDGSTDTATLLVTVNDLGPAAAVTGDTPIDEGQTGSFDASGSTSSPDYIVLYEWDLDGDGQFDDATGATAAYTWLDNGVYPVTVLITDEDGSTDMATLLVTVNDLGPTAAVSGDTPIVEGQTGSFDASGSTSNPDFIVLYEWDLDGDGQYNDATGPTAAYTWLDNGVYPVAVRITDEDGSTDTATLLVTVNDLGPIAFLTGDTVLVEGQTGTCDASGSTCNPDYIVLFEWDWEYDGSIFTPSGDTGATHTHTWSTAGAYTVAVRVTDEDGSTAVAALAVTVNPGGVVELPECITDLTARPKSGKVQIVWTHQGDAESYNVYRSTTSSVDINATNRIAEGLVTTYATYLDTNVVNGTTYYYNVTKIVNGVEECKSNETSATPQARTRTR